MYSREVLCVIKKSVWMRSNGLWGWRFRDCGLCTVIDGGIWRWWRVNTILYLPVLVIERIEWRVDRCDAVRLCWKLLNKICNEISPLGYYNVSNYRSWTLNIKVEVVFEYRNVKPCPWVKKCLAILQEASKTCSKHLKIQESRPEHIL